MAYASPSHLCSGCPGEEQPPARTRLLLAALRLFADQGYAKTSIRAIAAEAQANVAAVSYYFGDKAALYAALFAEPFGTLAELVPDFTQPELDLRGALQGFFQGALAPLHHGEIARQVVRLHIREMLEPAQQRPAALERELHATSQAMAALLSRHLDLPAADADLQRLALTLTGMAYHLWGQQEMLATFNPQLLGSPEAVDRWCGQLTDYALAMVAAEQQRRAGATCPARPAEPSGSALP
ncbi:CerR family C-terminal domain-containing protein [Melaminivora sp.]|uniref:CerR family C-terminal domain-containing protein n=1 Tax=Melaminivora sp. TaxID=1933032 RepID=UPI0028AF0559|nr:CerR family C-terminal domain-containing protein [Melaminivora sp.]